MLLIQSDMFKALWFMIYPIVTFIHGPVSSESRFCQVSGFFISIGIEASGMGRPIERFGGIDWLCRYCCPDDCYPFCTVHFQTQSYPGRRRPISISKHSICHLACNTRPTGVVGFHQQGQRLRNGWNILLSSSTAILVSISPHMGSSLRYFYYYSWVLCVYIFLRSVQVPRFHRSEQISI